MIDYESEFTVKEQIAADVRRRIEEGEWGPRKRLPSVTHLEQQYGVARNTMLEALGVLRGLGLIYTVKNRGSFVRAGADFVTAIVADGQTRIINRPARDTEIDELDLPEHGWVTVVERAGEVEVFPADKVEIRGSSE
ncbi:winged helix-turn-helix domain-containing protein [Nonomuraea monospora]|uniref:winged helix-turn-helix domain-containing protein n=1 Tax=Nonomuraea monospora TaxID=568818 RepID=UPI0031E2EBEE